MSHCKNIIVNVFDAIKKGFFLVLKLIFKPFVRREEDNKEIREKKKILLVDKEQNFELNKSKAVIEEIQDYIKNNFIADVDLDELKDLINYAKGVNLKSNTYLIKEAREKLEMKFLYVKGRIYHEKLSKQKENNEKKEKVQNKENDSVKGIIDNNEILIMKDNKVNKARNLEKKKMVINDFNNKGKVTIPRTSLKVLDKGNKESQTKKKYLYSRRKD